MRLCGKGEESFRLSAVGFQLKLCKADLSFVFVALGRNSSGAQDDKDLWFLGFKLKAES
jgi:hypothetical protein